MSHLFFGYFFLLLNYSVTIAGYSINVLPAFLGYFFLVKAGKELGGENVRFQKLQLPVKLLLVVSALAWIADSLGFLGAIRLVKILVLLVLDLAMLYVTYEQIKGLTEIENATNYDMKTLKLRKSWLGIAAATLLTHVSVYDLVAVVAAYAQLLFAVFFLYQFSAAVKGYNQQIEKPQAEEPAGEETAKDEASDEPVISFTASESDGEDDTPDDED